MAQPPEVWTFLASNVLTFLLGGSMTFLALKAYRRERTRALLFAVVGFGLITAGTLLEGIYQFGIKGTYFLTGLELLQLQTIERVVIALGLFALLYSLVRVQ